MIALACALLLGCGGAETASIDRRVEFHTAQVARHPRSWPAHASLGTAFLDRAKRTRDPRDVRRAEEAARASLGIQPNFEAWRLLASVSNFRHRFAEAAEWAERARAAMPEDPSLVALLVEAALGRGDLDAARSLVRVGDSSGGFYLEVARAKLLAATGDLEPAADLYASAANLASSSGSRDLAAWSSAQAAALFLDDGRAGPARPHLDRAAVLAPDDAIVLVHRAELAKLEGDAREALQLYEKALENTGDPAIAAAAYPAAVAAGEADLADRLFVRAEAGLRPALEAGEVYTLGALARLYAEREDRLDEALALARRNAAHVRDGEAQALLRDVEARATGGPRPRKPK